MDLTINQKNELIARYMEIEMDEDKFLAFGWDRIYLYNGEWKPARKLKYHLSWDWLMPVIEKIEQIESGRFGWCIDPFDIVITDYCNDEKEIINIVRDRPDSKLISDCYEAVISFIQWYKNNKL